MSKPKIERVDEIPLLLYWLQKTDTARTEDSYSLAFAVLAVPVVVNVLFSGV